MTQTLDEISLILIYSAMAVYALAFIAFALDLAKRSSEVKRQELGTAAGESAEVPVVAGVSTASGAVLNPASASAVTAAPQRGTGRGSGATGATGATATAATVEKPKRSVPLRLGVSFTILGFLIQVVGVVLRGIAADRVPWANMYEFSITGTAIIVGVFLLVLLRQDLRFLGTFVLGLILVLLGVATVNYYVPVSPLQPALQSAWLVIHVLVAIIGTAFFSLGGALSVMQLFQTRGDVLSRAATAMKLRFLRTMPDADTLERLAYRVNIVGFVLWTFTLIAGAIWAERAWGRYWGWDTKEVWTFIIWVIYAGYIHARATRGWRGSRSAWLAIIGFAAVLFNFGVVNVFFKGLHAYSGL